MKFLSIDVGIVNFSYAVVTVPDQDDSLNQLALIRKKRNARINLIPHTTVSTFIDQATLHEWKLVKIGDSTESMDHLVLSMCDLIKNVLERHLCGHLLIERQPAKNKKTTVLMYALFSRWYDKIPTNLVHGGIKMRLCKLLGFTIEEKGYEINKVTAIKATTSLTKIAKNLFCDDAKVAMFNAKKKKDDLSDSLLQAFAFHIYQPVMSTRKTPSQIALAKERKFQRRRNKKRKKKAPRETRKRKRAQQSDTKSSKRRKKKI